MPSVLGMTGFEGGQTTRDRLIVINAGSYFTTPVATASPSARAWGASNASARAPWYDDPNATIFEPSGAEYWYHYRYYSTSVGAGQLLGVGRNGSRLIEVGFSATNQPTIVVAGVTRATAASYAQSASVWGRYHVRVTGHTTGSVVSVYADGNLTTPVVSYTLIAADQTALGAIGKPNEFRFALRNGDNSGRVDDLVAWDPLAAGFIGMAYFVSCGIKGQVFTGAGAEAAWSGTYADIDEIPASDADKISATAVGQESSFTKPAVVEPNVFAVKVNARVTRVGTAAGANLAIKVREGASVVSKTMAAPGDGDVSAIFETNAAGAAWSPVTYDASRIGFASVT